MDEPTIETGPSDGPCSILDALKVLDGILVEVKEKVGDPVALTHVMGRLATLVEDVLPGLVKMTAGPEEKAQLVLVKEKIAEVERLLQTRVGILTGFSLHLKDLVEG